MKKDNTTYWIIGIILIGVIVGHQFIFPSVQFAMVGWDDSQGYIFAKSWCSYQEYWDEPAPPYSSDYEKTIQEDVPNELNRLLVLGYSDCEMIEGISWVSGDGTRTKPCITVVCKTCPEGMEKVFTTGEYNTGTCVCPTGTESFITDDGLITCVLPEEEQDYYRLYNNTCNLVTILPSETTINDYDTLEECEEYIRECIVDEDCKSLAKVICDDGSLWYHDYYCVDGNCSISTNIPPESCINISDCDYFFWFDNVHSVCGYKEFCGAFFYEDLKVFTTLEACESVLEGDECFFTLGDYCIKLWMVIVSGLFLFFVITINGDKRK